MKRVLVILAVCCGLCGGVLASVIDETEPVGRERDQAFYDMLDRLKERGINSGVARRSHAGYELTGSRFQGSAFCRSGHGWPMLPQGSCDSKEDCETKTDSMCREAGHGGVDSDTVSVTKHADGSKTCSGDCERNGAVAFVTCNKPTTHSSQDEKPTEPEPDPKECQGENGPQDCPPACPQDCSDDCNCPVIGL